MARRLVQSVDFACVSACSLQGPRRQLDRQGLSEEKLAEIYEEAFADVKSAIQFHIGTFGSEVLPDDAPVLEAFIA